MLRGWKISSAAKTGTAQANDLAHELERRIDTETRKRLTDMATTFETLAPGWQQRLEVHTAFVTQAGHMRHAIRAIRNACHESSMPDNQLLRFQVSCLFLRDAHRYLTGHPQGHERLALISGTVTDDGMRVISRMLEVEMDESSPGYVRGAPQATHKAIVQLVEHDAHQLFAVYHNHPMRGANGTRPSGTDIAHQQRLVHMGSDDVLGGIFSLDGFFRTFSTARDFSLSVYGNGAEVVTDCAREKVIKLSGVS